MRNPSHPTHAAEAMSARSSSAPAREDVVCCQSHSKLVSVTIRNSSDMAEESARVRVEVGLPERAQDGSCSICDCPAAPVEVVVTCRVAEDPAVFHARRSCPCSSPSSLEAEHAAGWSERSYRPGHDTAAGEAKSAGDGNARSSPERTRKSRTHSSRQEQSGGDTPRTGEDNPPWRAEHVKRDSARRSEFSSASKNSRRSKRQDHVSVETVSDINEKKQANFKAAWPAERMGEGTNKGYEDTSATAAEDKARQNADCNGNRIFMEPYPTEKSMEMLFAPQRENILDDSRTSRKFRNSESPRPLTEIKCKISENECERIPDSHQKESKIPSESLKGTDHALVDSAHVLPSRSKNLLEGWALGSFQQIRETLTGMSDVKKVDSAETKGNKGKFDTKTLPELITETNDFSPVTEKLGECMRNDENGAASTRFGDQQEQKLDTVTCETVHVDQGRCDYSGVTGTKVAQDTASRVASGKGDDVEDAVTYGLTNATRASREELLPGTARKYGDRVHPESAAMDELKRYVTKYPEFVNYYFQKRRVVSPDSDVLSRASGRTEQPTKNHCSGDECDVSRSSCIADDVGETNDKEANNAEPQLPSDSGDSAMLRMHLTELHDNQRPCDRSTGEVSADERNSGKCVSRTSSSDDDQSSSSGVQDDLHAQPFSVIPLVSEKILVKKSAISKLLLANDRSKITSVIFCSKKKGSPSLRESRPISRCTLQSNTCTPIVCDRHSGHSDNTHLKNFQEQDKFN